MTTTTQLWRKVEMLIALTAAALLLVSCGRTTPQATAADRHTSHPTVSDVAPVATTEYSIYDAMSTWRDATGVERTLATLSGRPRVMALAYTHCAYACPRILADLKRVESELGANADVGFVLVSIDPTRDTPARLAEYAAAARLDRLRWTLLTGDEGGVQELAALLGIRYRRVSDTEFEHSNVLTVLDASGAIAHRQVGLGADPVSTVRVLEQLTAPAR